MTMKFKDFGEAKSHLDKMSYKKQPVCFHDIGEVDDYVECTITQAEEMFDQAPGAIVLVSAPRGPRPAEIVVTMPIQSQSIHLL